jgi:hypothetical protein
MFCFSIVCSSISAKTPAPPAPDMPPDWKVTADFEVPPKQVETIEDKLDVKLSSVRNTIYDVNGKKVQLNVIITPDPANADKLMAKLREMKGEIALLRKELTVYEFVGTNDVLPIIAAGRKHLESK